MKIIPYDPKYKNNFIELNKAWITEMFVLEAEDQRELSNIEAYIEAGGQIFFAIADDESVMACCLIAPREDGDWEIMKFAASDRYRGAGAGSACLSACIDYAKSRHIERVIIVSNEKCAEAVHLYRKFGFEEMPVDRKKFPFERAGIAFEMKFDYDKERAMIRLVRPTAELREQALAFRQEFFDNGEPVINGSELLDKTDDYDEWLGAVTANASYDTVNPEWVVTDTFFAVDEDERIVGIIDLRHTLNDFLRDLGNCGYSVRPSERRRGYATEMLRQLLEVAREAGMSELQLSVERDNEPSIKTIRRNGGLYERSFEFDGAQADIYMINLFAK